jgi:hypothetical protein
MRERGFNDSLSAAMDVRLLYVIGQKIEGKI